MKIKTWLYPLVLLVSTLAIGIALIFPIFNYVDIAANELLASFGVFTNFLGIDAFATFTGITGIFVSSYLILGFVGLLISVVLTVLKMTGFEIKNFALCNRIAAGVALVGTIGFVVSAITFICINQYDISETTHLGFAGTFALWMAMGGLILGTIASYLGAIDIARDEKKAAEAKAIATAKVVEEKPAAKVVAAKKTTATAAKKTTATAAKKTTSTTTTKTTTAKKAEVKVEAKAETKPAVVKKSETKKTETKKAEAKPVAKTTTKKVEKKAVAPKTEVKTEAKKAEPAKKETAKKVEVKAEVKTAAKKPATTAKKTTAKTTTAKKVETKTTAAKTTAAKKTATKTAAKSTTKKTTKK